MAGAERLRHIFEWGRAMKKVGNHWSNHFPLDHVDSSEIFSNSASYLAENWMRDTVHFFFVTENRKCWLLRPVITINWMTNSIVFIVMVTHQCAFTPRMHLQGKAWWKLNSVANYQLLRSLQICNVRLFLIFVLQVTCRVWRPHSCSISQKYGFLAKIVPTDFQLLRAAIALLKPKENSLMEVS